MVGKFNDMGLRQRTANRNAARNRAWGNTDVISTENRPFPWHLFLIV